MSLDTMHYEAVLRWWFADVTTDPVALLALSERQTFWFQGSAEVDKQIDAKFGTLFTAASEGKLTHWANLPHGRLALIIVLDQFSRNLRRNTADAFSNDPQSYRYCLDGLDRGDDLKLNVVERIFFYLPLEHAEDLDAQRRSLACYRGLLAAVPKECKSYFADTLQYATIHHDIIKRFGRFPHRNQVLGRHSTEAEEVYMANDAPRFGQ